MWTRAIAGAFLFSLAAWSSAYSADLPAAPIATPAAIPATWTGCYIGIHGGGGIVNSSWNSENGGGGLAGGQVGCNYQIGRVVIGVEGEGFWSGISANTNFSSGTLATGLSTSDSSVKNRWDADVALRLGFLVDERILIYGKVGAAVGEFDFYGAEAFGFSPLFFFSSSTSGNATLVGALVGIGSEFLIAPNWSAKLEYNYINYLGHTLNVSTARLRLPARQVAEQFRPTNIL